MSLTNLPVIKVMGGSNFHSTSSFGRIRVIISYYWNLSSNQWQNNRFPNQISVSFISWVYNDCSVSKKCFRPRSCDNYMIRRTAADFGIALVTNPQVFELLAAALTRHKKGDILAANPSDLFSYYEREPSTDAWTGANEFH